MRSSSAPGSPPTPGWSRARGVAVVDASQDVVDGQPGGVLYLGPLPEGPLRVLSGTSAVLYRALVDRSEDPPPRVARELGVPLEDIDPEAITEFAQELLRAGLLVQRG